MNTPILLLGATLVFWGWQVDLLIVGVILAVLLEGARATQLRWEFSDKEQRRLADLCIYLMVGALVYTFISGKGANGFFLVSSWLPILVSPLVLIQAYGNRAGLNLTALSLLARNKQSQNLQQGKKNELPKIIDISYGYLALCLLSAGSANNRSPWFYIILFLLVAWTLWSKRNTRYPSHIAIGLLLCAGASGYIGQIWLQQLQQLVEQKSLEWMGIDGEGKRDPFQANTAIGSLGTLKLSDTIVMRVFPEKGNKPPDLLRNACYNVFARSRWYVSSQEVRQVASGPEKTTWELHPQSDTSRINRITISTQLADGEGLLAVPTGTGRLANLPVEKVEQGLYSAIRLTGGPRRIYPIVSSDSTADYDLPPAVEDLLIPDELRPVLQSIVAQNSLIQPNPRDTLRAMEDYFKKHYTYSLVQTNPEVQKHGLEFFLTRSHSGHCELFASATVLLLRMMGLPARYVTGWAVSEYSPLENCYLIRSRHAHSWTTVYVDNRWQVLDTTPPYWQAADTKQDSLFRPLSDFFSWCRYTITSWLDNKRPEIPAPAGWLAALIGLLLGLRFFRKKERLRKKPTPAAVITKPSARGTDSPFYRIEQFLTEQEMGRHPSESLSQWLARLDRDRIGEERLRQLSHLLTLHYKYRFDPDCDMELCGKELLELSNGWLTAIQKQNSMTIN